ncbi:MAG TPA: galactose oxidase-like domain-containing protein [Vicinamibacterales bacterium]|nr:galactose oxidase-like domain-containing protein [Vicinamibacterales bacterium]
MIRQVAASSIAAAFALVWHLTGAPPVTAQSGLPDPNAGLDPAVFGKVSPFVPMQSAEAVHMGLVWKRDSDQPKILYHARFPEYVGSDMADPAMTDLAIERGALTTAGNQFNSSLRDVLHGFDPFLGLGTARSADDSFQRLTYGGYLMRQGLSQSVPTRIVANRTMERQLLFDPFHADAFKNGGKFHTALLDENDFALNRAAFAENGYSKGMFYNTYCNARVTLADGRVYVFGGHDMQSDNGLYKVNIFDPETELWTRRSEPCTRSNWTRDRFGLALFAGNPGAPFYESCDPRDQQSTQPSDPSDQKYARWYPSAAPLPNGWVLVLGGFDQDGTLPPDPLRVEKGRNNQSQNDAGFTASRVNIVVPEVYDPVTDRNIALENARMAFPLYPQMEVVQTGPNQNDWKVCTYDGEINYGSIESEVTPAAAYRNARGERTPGGARFGVGGGTPPFRDGNTWCLDVLGAMKDPKRSTPAKNHWTFLDKGAELRPYCCSTASFVEINADGLTTSHKWFMISGQDAAGDPTGTVEVMEFTDPAPKWRKVGSILQPLATTKVVLLPDGQVLVGQGVNRGVTCPAGDVECFDEKEGHFFQMFDPSVVDRGLDIETRRLARTTVSRGLHGTATLLPDASVFFAGENREALIRPDDPRFPLLSSYAGSLPRGDPDLGVPVGQVFSPPYLFTSGGAAAPRPAITGAPREIQYRGTFDIQVDGPVSGIRSVALVRSDHNTHSLTAGDRHVKLAFRAKGNPSGGELRVTAPKLPAQAVPGVYMLYVVNTNGVPSVGKQIRIKPETRGSTTPFR